MGVLIKRALLFGVYAQAPVWKLPPTFGTFMFRQAGV